MQTLTIAQIHVGTRLRALDSGKVEQLAASIVRLGLLQPITVRPDYTLVCGYHRLEAVKRLGWKRVEAMVLEKNDLETALAEIDENLIRHELTVLERGEHLAKRKELYLALHPETKTGVAGGKARQGSANEIISFADDAATTIGTSARTVQQEIQIATRLGSSARTLIQDTPFANNKTDLLKLVRLEADTQQRVAQKLACGEVRDFKSALENVNREKRFQTLVEAARNTPPLCNAVAERVTVLLSDPPWRYEHCSDKGVAIENHYPTMILSDICNLPVQDVVTRDAILFLWAPSAKMEEAMTVIGAWGFAYRTCAVWIKPSSGVGYYFRQQHECLLVATRGHMPTPERHHRPTSVFHAERGRHSEKPACVYDMIEAMYPDLPKLEMFARSPRNGWHAWGNEVSGDTNVALP